MSTKFQDKYRISSARLHNWDYTWNAFYFVTINVYAQEEVLGEIRNGKMFLSNLGTIADVFWYEIKNHFPVVDLDAFVVMANHVHGILAINNPENYLQNKKASDKETGHALSIQQSKNQGSGVETRHALSHEEYAAPGDKRFQNPGEKSPSTIVGSYKSAVSKHAHRLGYEFEWQTRFYDSIIRDKIGLLKARKYIETNVVKWDKNEFNTRIS